MSWDRQFDYNYTIDGYRVSSQSYSPPMGWDRLFDYNYTIDGYRGSSQSYSPFMGWHRPFDYNYTINRIFWRVRDSIPRRPHGGILGRSQTGGQCPSPIPLSHWATHRLPCGKSTCRLNFLYIAVWPGWHLSVRKASCEFEAERHKAAKDECRRQKE